MVGAVLDEVQVVHVVDLGAFLGGEGGLVSVAFRLVHEAVDEPGGYLVEAQNRGGVVLDQLQGARLDLVAEALGGAVVALEFVLAYVHFGLEQERDRVL